MHPTLMLAAMTGLDRAREQFDGAAPRRKAADTGRRYLDLTDAAGAGMSDSKLIGGVEP